jgi:transcriptional regulator with XRE-family HTH domain
MDKAAFRRLRLRLGLTQEELAERLGKNRLSIIRYESGFTTVPKAVEMALKLIASEQKK